MDPETAAAKVKTISDRIHGRNPSATSNCKNDRSEDIYYVEAAKSVKPRAFWRTSIDQNPRLGENSYGSPHGDSYCSESVGSAGPNTEEVRVIRQRNPYGYTPCMVSNKKNQMIGVSIDLATGYFTLVVYTKDCKLISATRLYHDPAPGEQTTFGGGYFFMNDLEQTIVGTRTKLFCYNTDNVPEVEGDDANSLEHVWETPDLLELCGLANDDDKDHPNALYSAMPVWTFENDTRNLYWVLFAGNYSESITGGQLHQPAAMGLIEVKGNRDAVLLGIEVFENEWNNNTFSVDETGAYFVTNVVNSDRDSSRDSGSGSDSDSKRFGYLRKVAYDAENNTIHKDPEKSFHVPYETVDYFKEGQKNIGSGTTPTLINQSDDLKLVAIADNADPMLHVVLYNRDTGVKVSEVPVFPPMRGAAEASLIGVKDAIFVENNFNHLKTYPESQMTKIEPGMTRINVKDTSDGTILAAGTETNWVDDRTSYLAMSMLARRNGVIFAHTADWSGDLSSTHGGMYYISAIDAHTGRTIWSVPLGRGVEFCHDYGGVYFNRAGHLYIGTANYFISVQRYSEPELAPHYTEE